MPELEGSGTMRKEKEGWEWKRGVTTEDATRSVIPILVRNLREFWRHDPRIPHPVIVEELRRIDYVGEQLPDMEWFDGWGDDDSDLLGVSTGIYLPNGGYLSVFTTIDWDENKPSTDEVELCISLTCSCGKSHRLGELVVPYPSP